MARANRLRCPQCGMCYVVEQAAASLKEVNCQGCGAITKLVEEDPDGLCSGALPPATRFIGIAVALLFTLLSMLFWIFAIMAVCALFAVLAEAIWAHKKQRAERIVMWNRLGSCYQLMADRNRNLNATLSSTRQELTAELDAVREALSTEAQVQASNARAELEGVNEALATLTDRYDRISPERREQLGQEIVAQQQLLGAYGNIAELRAEQKRMEKVADELKKRIISFEKEELYESFGFYKPLYDCVDSAAYSQLLDTIRSNQKAMVKEKKALRIVNVFASDGDKATEKKISKSLEKLILRAFNGECDATIDKVTFSNLDAISTRITKAQQDLNDLCQVVGVAISQAYLNSKLEELHVCYEYQMKLKDEKEEQRKIREQMREQARLIKEIEDARKKIEKEETHFMQAIAELQARMAAASEAERKQYEAKLAEYREKLVVVEKDKEQVAYREQSTRAGNVYIISNIGSFGEDVFKIGVSRRLDPQERVDELGDASVPFEFDVHAMIFSDDAPALEGALHEHFADRTLNKVNPRKEFFRVSLAEIEEVVRTHHNKVVEFTKIARAEDYRMSMAKERAVAAASAGAEN